MVLLIIIPITNGYISLGILTQHFQVQTQVSKIYLLFLLILLLAFCAPPKNPTSQAAVNSLVISWCRGCSFLEKSPPAGCRKSEVASAGKRLQKTMENHHAINENHHFQWVNPTISMAICNSKLLVYQRVVGSGVLKPCASGLLSVILVGGFKHEFYFP